MTLFTYRYGDNEIEIISTSKEGADAILREHLRRHGKQYLLGRFRLAVYTVLDPKGYMISSTLGDW